MGLQEIAYYLKQIIYGIYLVKISFACYNKFAHIISLILNGEDKYEREI